MRTTLFIFDSDRTVLYPNYGTNLIALSRKKDDKSHIEDIFIFYYFQ